MLFDYSESLPPPPPAVQVLLVSMLDSSVDVVTAVMQNEVLILNGLRRQVHELLVAAELKRQRHMRHRFCFGRCCTSTAHTKIY